MKKITDKNVCEFCHFCKITDVLNRDLPKKGTYQIYNCTNFASCIFGSRVISSFSCKYFKNRSIK